LTPVSTSSAARILTPARFFQSTARWLAAVCAATLLAATAFAHRPSISSLHLEATTGSGVVKFRLRYDPTNPMVGHITPADLKEAEPLLANWGPHWMEIGLGATTEPQSITLPDGQFEFLEADNECEWRTTIPLAPKGVWHIRLVKLLDVAANHREYVTASVNGTTIANALLTPESADMTIDWDAAATAKAEGKAAPSGNSGLFGRFMKMGIEHILTGIDHLLYIGGLVLGCRKIKPLLAMITSFTAAHSITLALSATNVFALPSSIVEPTIAATIALVAIENIYQRGKPPYHRTVIAFVFGLIHGFGFASILRELGLGHDVTTMAISLFSFNFGVEIGQLTVLAPVVPLLWWARKSAWFTKWMEPALSGVIACAGIYWFIERVFF
jgi:hydrogenase/urease accessory protein HupE